MEEEIKEELKCDKDGINNYKILKILKNMDEYDDILSTFEYKKIYLIKEMMKKLCVKLEDINVNMILKYENEVNPEDFEELQVKISPLFRLCYINSVVYKDYYYLLIKMIRNVSGVIDNIKIKYVNKGNDRICYYMLKKEFQEYLKR